MPSGIKKVFISHLTDVFTTDRENVGTIRFEGQNVYKWVKFTGANVVAAGDLVGYDTAVTDLTTVNGVATALPAGIAMAAVLVAGGVQYGWVQVRGNAISSAALAGSPAVGGAMIRGTYPAVTQVATTGLNTDILVGYTVHVANKIVNLQLPW